MLEFRKIHVSALESYSFGFQQESLLKTKFAWQGNSSSRAQNALPGKARHLIQHLGHVTGTAGIAGGLGDRAISAYTSAGNPADYRG